MGGWWAALVSGWHVGQGGGGTKYAWFGGHRSRPYIALLSARDQKLEVVTQLERSHAAAVAIIDRPEKVAFLGLVRSDLAVLSHTARAER